MDRVLQAIEAESRAKTGRVVALLIEQGRQDLVAELLANLKNIANGVTCACGTWHALTPSQRAALVSLSGKKLVRDSGRRYWRGSAVYVLQTLRALISRDLAHPNGSAFDPEKEVVITERGRFVLKHGRREDRK